MELLYILSATLIISLGALAGVVTYAVQAEKLAGALLWLVAFSAGAMMGGAFLHLLPEAVAVLPAETVFMVVLLAFGLFFLVEKLFHWRHCHKGECLEHSFGGLNLLGDSLHNFIDGLIIAGAFLTDVRLGWVTALAVALHEIPQEIGDFGVLLYSGYSRKRALFANFAVALTVVLGGLAGYFLGGSAAIFVPYLLPVAAGGFIYIAASDLLPEIRKETRLKKSMLLFAVFLAGLGLMNLIK